MDTRILPFDGIHNFRDHGGYAVAGGGHLREGVLYRSAQHRDATEADLARIAALGLAVVVDLRGARERAGAPCPRPEGFAARVISVDRETAGLAPHIAAARDVGDPAEVRDAMRNGYAGMPFRPVLIELMRDYFAALSETDGPTLIHCMAGKDRTGLAVALLHAALGVHRDDIIADYVLTNSAGDVEARIAAGAATVRAHYPGANDATVRALMMVEQSYLEAALAAIEERHGGVDGYLADVLGVDDRRCAAIMERLIV